MMLGEIQGQIMCFQSELFHNDRKLQNLLVELKEVKDKRASDLKSLADGEKIPSSTNNENNVEIRLMREKDLKRIELERKRRPYMNR